MTTSNPTYSLGGVACALTAAVLFGISTPLAKLFSGRVDPLMLAGLLYLGSGVGLSTWWLLRKRIGHLKQQEAPLRTADIPWLGSAILFGGIIAPVLLMVGLSTTPASTASLLLNLEGVLTAVLAWWIFKENFDRRIALGMLLITVGGVILTWEGWPAGDVPWGALAIAGACLAWAIDNNLTRKLSGGDPVQIASLKGLVAGSVNLGIALVRGAELPGLWTIISCTIVGLLGYGVSLTLFVIALRYLGTARTGAYFSVAPFAGAAVSLIFLGDSITLAFFIAVVFMGLGVWLHLTERHEHVHKHEPLEHEHLHTHDEHHRHEHLASDPSGEPHSHPHRHEPILHSHPHYPDIHHRHEH